MNGNQFIVMLGTNLGFLSSVPFCGTRLKIIASSHIKKLFVYTEYDINLRIVLIWKNLVRGCLGVGRGGQYLNQ
jgi:hypothetical protein